MHREGIGLAIPPQEKGGLETKLGTEYQTIDRLFDRLDGPAYLENDTLREEEIDELCTTILSILDADPSLDHIFTDPKKFKLWNRLSKTAYKCLKQTASEENARRLSHILGRTIKIADPETNISPADGVLDNLVDRWPWSDSKYAPKHTSLSEKNEAVLREYCNQFGLDAESLFRAWFASHQSINFRLGTKDGGWHPVQTALENCLEMRRLERHRPGAPKMLVNDFGVRCFSRYPKGMLDDQIDQMEDTETPHGVVITSIGDHNGISYAGQSVNSLLSLSDQAKKLGLNIRVIETNGKVDLLKKLLFLDRKYHRSSGQKIKFGIISGHGNEEVLEIGMDRSAVITTEDVLTDEFRTASKRFFETGAYIALNSCLTGKEGKLAQQASASMPNLHFVASPDTVNSVIYTLTPSGEGGAPPRLSVSYQSRFKPRKKSMRSYQGGERK